MTGENSPKSGSGQSASQPSRLCQACRSVLERDGLELKRTYPHHSTLKAFMEASYSRCYVCSWLYLQLYEDEQSVLKRLAEGKAPDHMMVERDENTNTGVSDQRARLRASLEIVAALWDESDPWVSFTVMRIEAPGYSESCRKISVCLNPSYEGFFPLETRIYDTLLKDTWEAFGVGQVWENNFIVTSHEDLTSKGLALTVPSHTGSIETWSTVDQWLRVCSELHSCTAKVNRDCQWYPTRLVERISNERFRIIRSDSSLFQRGRGYITLSHQWGDKSFVKLTKDNVSKFENGSPIKELRKSFQDTLTIAQRMNIPYVWIDSLCIIQSGDNKEDWGKESGLMAEVYSNSFCNISADWGDESNGLFFERTPIFQPPCAIQMRWKLPSNLDESPRLSPEGDPGYIVRRGDWVKDATESPLNRRGWVLQERLLAPRVLHFSPEQVSWECGELFSWEKAPWCYSSQAPLDNHRDWIGYGIIKRSMERVNLNRQGKTASWEALVGEYTRCDLTKQSDRLVAIAGIAKRLAPIKGQYVAGLWAKSLPGTLLWHAGVNKRSRPSSEDYGYYAPTFSWAAAYDEVSLPDDPDEPDVQLRFTASATFIKYRDSCLDSAATTTMRTELDGQILTNDIFGPLTTPEVEVRVQGILRSCRPLPPELTKYAWNNFAASKDVDDPAKDDCFDFEGVTTFNVHYDRVSDEEVQSDLIVYYYTIIQRFSESDSASTSPRSRHGRTRGLFLRSVDAKMGRFERLGEVRHFRDEKNDICQPLGNERDLPAWSYNETTGEHTFYIV